MSVYPNGRHMSKVAGRHFGGLTAAVGGSGAGFDTVQRTLRGNRLGRFAGEEHLPTASTPDGYGMQALVPPITAGSMSALVRGIEITGSGNLLQGGPMEGTGSISLTAADAALSMIVSMAGTGSISLTPLPAVLSMVVGMEGSGSVTLTGSGALSMIVPFEGVGSMTLTASGDLKGLLNLQGGWTPYTELSPENLAASVWGAVATANNTAGTMGAKLNTASSGGVDLNALAAAVWAYASRTLTGAATALTPEQAAQLQELHRIHGLESGTPLVVTPTARAAGDISQVVSTVSTTVTVSRVD